MSHLTSTNRVVGWTGSRFGPGERYALTKRRFVAGVKSGLENSNNLSPPPIGFLPQVAAPREPEELLRLGGSGRQLGVWLHRKNTVGVLHGFSFLGSQSHGEPANSMLVGVDDETKSYGR